MTASTRSGPVRSEAARQAILTAAVELLAERGYDHLAIEGIAARAGVGKQTIYRWWRSKSAIIAEALLEGMILRERLDLPNTGDVRADLSTWLEAIGEVLLSPQGEGLARSLIAAATDNADVGRRLRDAIAGSGALSTRLHAASGTEPNLTPGAPIDEIAEALVGALLLRALSRSPLDDAAIRGLITVALGPEAP
ncbi:TetR/AcrR family transcriptional regulator [Leucobacter japonicus]|uniref:TetR/AcrR family transcriptional regulator n=1 Tax=Leucobacter japonicus TaxID=1461259 RepID=UPI0006A7A947|nr:TetR/AcrR family transcriptional regulator [Leucobacter japonicus]